MPGSEIPPAAAKRVLKVSCTCGIRRLIILWCI